MRWISMAGSSLYLLSSYNLLQNGFICSVPRDGASLTVIYAAVL